MKKHLNKHIKNSGEINKCIYWLILLIGPFPAVAMIMRDNRTFYHLFLLLTGWLCWTFTEYCMHRFRDHGESYTDRAVHESLHHLHHRHPTELRITAIHRSILFVLCAMAISLAIWMNNFLTILPGFVLGITSYAFTHWFLHHKISAKIFPELHRFHIHHHCKHPDKCFGVTVTWWDHLFGTVPKEDTEITERVRTFYYKKEKKKIISLNNIMDEKIQVNEKRSA